MIWRASTFLSIVILFAFPKTSLADAEALIRNMKPAWKRVSDISMEMQQFEKLSLSTKKINKQNTYLKFAKPFRVYAKFMAGPFKGREVLYQGKSWNGGKIMVALEKFPRITTSVFPFSKRALDKKHHPITHVGFAYLINTAIKQIDLAAQNNELDLRSLGSDTIDGRSCTKIMITLNASAGTHITPQKRDTWRSLAKRYNTDAYVLQYNNEGKSPGNQKNSIWVPTYYGSKMEACIDDATNLPLKVTTWDHAGNLYEEYTFRKIKVNIGLSDIDFDPKNSEYEF